MMKRILPHFFLGLLICSCSWAKDNKSDFPEWASAALHNQASDTIKGNPEAVILYSEHLLTVGADGNIVTRERSVVKILRPQGKRHAECSASYDVEQKLNFMHGWTFGADEKYYTAKDTDFADFGLAEAKNLQLSERVRQLNPPAGGPGAVVACEFELKLRPYLNEDIWHFQDSIPLVNGVFELQLPAGWQFYSVWKGRSPVQPAEVQPSHWRWEVHDVPALDLRNIPMHPAWRALAERMSVHYGQTVASDPDQRWQQIGAWYQDLAAHRADPSPEIAARAHAVADGERDFFPRLQRITEYIQKNIRYFIIEVGIGGQQPHFASDIYRNQFGDCKDKATLLISMLSAVGIQANYVLVDTERGTIDPKVPSRIGDHMITAIEVPEGYSDPRLQAIVKTGGKRYLIFDPTDTMTPVGSLRADLQGGYGLLVSAQASKVTQLPILAPEANTVRRKGEFELSADGTLKGHVIETRQGDSAEHLRYTYTVESEEKAHQTLERRLRDDFSSLTLTGESASHVKELDQPLELKYEISASSYARQAGDLLLVRPRVLGSDAIPFNDKVRKYPVDLEETGKWQDSFDIRLPAGYVVDELPAAVTLDTDFASYHSSVTAKENALHYEREYIVNQLELPPQEYPKMTKLMGAILEDEQATAVLKKH